MSRSVLISSLVLLFLAAPGRAEEPDTSAAWTALKAEAADRLADLAREAQARKLFRTRDELYERVLVFEPDHEKARSWLKYRRRDGVWVQVRYVPPRDRGGTSSRSRQEAAIDAWWAWWRTQAGAVHRQAVAADRERVAAEILEFALALDGEDPAIRALAGEVPHGEGEARRWILRETHRALANRARYLETARKAARSAKPVAASTPNAADPADGTVWPTTLAGETVRVFGAVPEEELRRHLAIAESAAAVFGAVFGVEARLPAPAAHPDAPFPLYVATGRKQGNSFLAREPGIDAQGLALLADLDLAFLPTRPGAVVKTSPEPARLEATVHAVQAHLTRPHLGHEPTARGAWAREAVTLYLAWLHVRTRNLCTVSTAAPAAAAEAAGSHGPFGRPRPDVDADAMDLDDATTDWHARAADALRDLATPEVRAMSAKRAQDLDALDLMAGYGLAVYVLEARPDVSAAFFREVATQQAVDLDAALAKHLGADLETLRPHLLRWLDEMGALAPPPGAPR